MRYYAEKKNMYMSQNICIDREERKQAIIYLIRIILIRGTPKPEQWKRHTFSWWYAINEEAQIYLKWTLSSVKRATSCLVTFFTSTVNRMFHLSWIHRILGFWLQAILQWKLSQNPRKSQYQISKTFKSICQKNSQPVLQSTAISKI